MPRNGQIKLGSNEVTGPRSLTRLLGLFDVLAKAKDGMTLAELNQALQSPKSSLLNLLRPLVSDGYLACDNGRYRLGPSIFRLAANIISVWNFSSTMRPYLEELAERSEESVYIGVLEKVGGVITYVDAIESPQSVRFSVPIGAARPLYSTAAGRVLLAFGDQEWVENYLRNTKITAYTPFTISSRKALREELEKIRRTRISVSLGETFPESGAISAPIFGADAKLIAAIAVGAPVTRLEPRLAELRPIITEIASRASGSTRSMLRASEAGAAAASKRAPAPAKRAVARA
jgi:IclR family transcriptional regulator, acetate operon repressor